MVFYYARQTKLKTFRLSYLILICNIFVVLFKWSGNLMVYYDFHWRNFPIIIIIIINIKYNNIYIYSNENSYTNKINIYNKKKVLNI